MMSSSERREDADSAPQGDGKAFYKEGEEGRGGERRGEEGRVCVHM